MWHLSKYHYSFGNYYGFKNKYLHFANIDLIFQLKFWKSDTSIILSICLCNQQNRAANSANLAKSVSAIVLIFLKSSNQINMKTSVKCWNFFCLYSKTVIWSTSFEVETMKDMGTYIIKVHITKGSTLYICITGFFLSSNFGDVESGFYRYIY